MSSDSKNFCSYIFLLQDKIGEVFRQHYDYFKLIVLKENENFL